MASMIGGMISLAISSIVLVSVLITTVKSANTTGWTTAEVSLWGTITVVAIAGFLYGVAAVFGVI